MQSLKTPIATKRIEQEVEAAILVGSALPDNSPLKLRLRTHRLLRGLLPFWRCLSCGKLMSHGEQECPDCGTKALPLVLCRTCGWDFFAAYEPENAKGQLRPWVQLVSSEQTVFLYEPPEAGIEVDTEEVADTEEEIPEEGVEAKATAQMPQLRTWRICPKCLAIVRNGRCPSGCSVPLQNFAVKKQRGTICPVCQSRYGSRDVLTKVSMGVSRALKEVARTLIQNLPSEQRKVLIFCDSRQDAP